MGAPKQKWTAEEESALKAGVKKHGVGKWRNILKDPEFSTDLQFRSNIDLKDKWRNMSVTGNVGCMSTERAKPATKKRRRLSRSKELDEEGEYSPPMAIKAKVEEVTPITSSSGPLQIESKETKKPIKRFDNLILEALTQLQEHEGSNQTSIAMYIEEKYQAPPDFQRLLSAKIKSLVDSGKLIKVNRNYKLAPTRTSLQERTPRTPPPRTENYDVKKQMIMRAEGDLAATIQEAADFAARAVAEAEMADAEAIEAKTEADKIEVEAQAAQAIVESVILHLKNRNSATLMIQA
ncbi:telomere repeat binding factor 1 [Rhynchospora pubera]|uniref:Telomere repeat binding factor 1 n=1 Tax=Rhynchospora pubera TaxID=906938 RepID=A0AAV8DMI9_9POAL|nr:telomere repeat binding factor 1 [Rhynchospora pubera]